jgi:hypothetical protein
VSRVMPKRASKAAAAPTTKAASRAAVNPRSASNSSSAAKPASYDVHPSVAMVQDWVATLPERTGRSLAQWLELVRKHGPSTAPARRDWLKREHGLGSNAAGWLAARAEGKGLEDGDPQAYLAAAAKHVEAMFAGSKAGLRPLYGALLRLGRAQGKDVRVCPC